MRIVQAIRTFQPGAPGWRCSACKYDISGLPEGELEAGARAIHCPECGSLCMTAHAVNDLTPAIIGREPIPYNPKTLPRSVCSKCRYTNTGSGPDLPFCPNCGVSRLHLQHQEQARRLRRADRRLLPRLIWPFAAIPAAVPLYLLFGRESLRFPAVMLAALGTANAIYWFKRLRRDPEVKQDLSLLGGRMLLRTNYDFEAAVHPLVLMLLFAWGLSVFGYFFASLSL